MLHAPVSRTLLLAALAACAPAEQRAEGDTASARDTARAAGALAGPAMVVAATGFKTPESVRYDAADDVFFVSNINGNPNGRDNNGFISRVRPEGQVDSLMFVAGGRGGVTLNAPKGVLVAGDTIWVTDIDAVRAFNKKTGAPLRSIDFRPHGAVFLNDIAAGPDAVYVTDTGIRFAADGSISHPGPDRIFRLDANGRVSVAAQGDTLGRPNGIAWDAANGRFILGGFGTKNIYAWKPAEKAPTVLATGAGGYDGLDVLDDGRILVSSWTDSTVSVVTGTTVERLITGVAAPADFGVDTKRRRLALPRFQDNRVELWSLPAR